MMSDNTALVQSLALLVLHLIDDAETCSIAGITDDELDAALGNRELMDCARAEAVKLTLSGGRAEVRAARALDAAAIRLQQIAESPESRITDVIAATNALCTLAGTREKLRARQLSPIGQAKPVVSYVFNLGGDARNADEHRLLLEYRSKREALVADIASASTTARGANDSHDT
jgi:hypothetical protein